jgi:HAD superfamily hydrolase (TIGR01549 family)
MNGTLPKIIILDLDGTLYIHSLLRTINVVDLTINLLKRNLSKSDLHVLVAIRRHQEISSIREEAIQRTFESVASRFEIPVSTVISLRNRWMVDNQKWALLISKRRWLVRSINKLRREGVLVAVWSDNPVEKKLRYLGYNTDYSLSSEDETINVGKPNPKGLVAILTYFNLGLSEAIFIGDRMDRDGLAAQRAGVQFHNIGIKSRFYLFKLNRELSGK